MKGRWEWIGNKSSLTLAEQCVEKYGEQFPEYEYKTGKPGGRHKRDRWWMVGLYRRRR